MLLLSFVLFANVGLATYSMLKAERRRAFASPLVALSFQGNKSQGIRELKHWPVFTLSAALALAAWSTGTCDEPKKSSAVVVKGRQLTFDPKTCTEGKGMFYWGLGSVRVTVLGQKDGNCMFDYQWEVEGAGSYVVHRVKAPIDSGPVVIDADRRREGDKHNWSTVFTSFTDKQATLIRKAGIRWWEDLVEGTNAFVAYQSARGGTGKPVAAGQKVSLRFTVFAGDDFKALADGAKQGQMVALTVGTGEDRKWARVASAEMRDGEVRRVKVPAKIAGDAKSWLPGVRDDATLFLELALTVVEGK
jgi:hypothetical protein